MLLRKPTFLKDYILSYFWQRWKQIFTRRHFERTQETEMSLFDAKTLSRRNFLVAQKLQNQKTVASKELWMSCKEWECMYSLGYRKLGRHMTGACVNISKLLVNFLFHFVLLFWNHILIWNLPEARHVNLKSTAVCWQGTQPQWKQPKKICCHPAENRHQISRIPPVVLWGPAVLRSRPSCPWTGTCYAETPARERAPAPRKKRFWAASENHPGTEVSETLRKRRHLF